jgi:hypothetical protein
MLWVYLTASLVVGLGGCASKPAQTDKAVAATSVSPDCIRDTGTRITERDHRTCLNVPGSSYTQDDLNSTGQTNTAAALRQLDPRLR